MNLSKNALLLRCCYLFYQENLTIQEIAQQMNISRFKVSRYIKEAQEKGIVQVQFHDPGIEHERLAMQMEQTLPFKRVIVVPTPYDTDVDGSRLAVGRAAVDLFQDLAPETTLGITWGRTVAYMVDNLPADRLQIRSVVELAGGFGQITTDLSARAVTLRSAEKLKAECVQLPAPIITDSVLSARSMMAESSIRNTLELAAQADVAVTGIGPINLDSLLHRSGFLSSEDFWQLRESGAVGSIIGRFFNLHGEECDTDYRDRAIALTLPTFCQIPERIALAAGKHKVDSLVGLANGQLITTLVTDSETALEVLERYQQYPDGITAE
jgi:DNA-binding transcriptional regulator LsrR (DeoR family)